MGRQQKGIPQRPRKEPLSVKRAKKPRNSHEQANWDLLMENRVDFGYEETKYPYVVHRNYIPDFTLPNGIVVETKGYFRLDDRAKMRAVKKCYPDLDIRLVFMESTSPSSRRNLDVYIRWCKKYGFPWAVKLIPQEWLHDKGGYERIDPKKIPLTGKV